MTDTVVILAGGMSSRMKSSSSDSINSSLESQANSRSKSLITINSNRPILDSLLINIQSAGIKNVILLTGEENKLFKSYYGENNKDNTFENLSISYAVQKIPDGRVKPFGTADALLQTLEQFPELQSGSFIVCNSDNLYSSNAFKLLRSDINSNAFINYDRSGFEFKSDRAHAFAITESDDNNYLIDVIEKPAQEQIDSFLDKKGAVHVSMNIFKFSGNDIYPFLKNCPVNPIRNEKELPTALLNMINTNNVKVKAIDHSEHVPDLTSKSDIKEIENYIKKGQFN